MSTHTSTGSSATPGMTMAVLRAALPPMRRFWPAPRRGFRGRGVRGRPARGQRVAHRARQRAAARALPLGRRRRRAVLRPVAGHLPLPRAPRRARRRAAAARHDPRHAGAPAGPARARRAHPHPPGVGARRSRRRRRRPAEPAAARGAAAGLLGGRRPRRCRVPRHRVVAGGADPARVPARRRARGDALGLGCGRRAPSAISHLFARRLADAVLDHFGSLDVLIAYGAEEESRRAIADADARLRRAVTRRAGAQAGTAALVSLLAGAASIAAVCRQRAGCGIRSTRRPAVRRRRPRADGRVRGVRVGADGSVGVAPGALVCRAHRRDGARPRSPPDSRPRRIPASGEAPALGAGLSLRSASVHWPDRWRVWAHPQRPTPPRRSTPSISTSVRANACSSSARAAPGKSTLAHALVRFLETDGVYDARRTLRARAGRR